MLTIAVTLYNIEEFVEQCARSLFEQTLKEIDFLFVDDASTDDSVAIVEQTLKDYPERQGQVRFIHHEQNKGIAYSRREAIEAVEGDYFIFVDGDDYVEPRYAELLYNRAQETGADVVMCDYYHHYKNHEDYYVRKVSPQGEGENGSILRDGTINTRINPNLWFRLIRTRILLENEILWPKTNVSEDRLISVQAAYYARKMAYVELPLYHYRYNTTSITRTEDEKKKIKLFEDSLVNFRVLKEFVESKKVKEQYPDCLFYTKLLIRSRLLPFFEKRKYRRKYLRTFPEMNWIYLLGNKYHKPTKRERVWIIAIATGIYPLMSTKLVKYCRPASAWYK